MRSTNPVEAFLSLQNKSGGVVCWNGNVAYVSNAIPFVPGRRGLLKAGLAAAVGAAAMGRRAFAQGGGTPLADNVPDTTSPINGQDAELSPSEVRYVERVKQIIAAQNEALEERKNIIIAQGKKIKEQDNLIQQLQTEQAKKDKTIEQLNDIIDFKNKELDEYRTGSRTPASKSSYRSLYPEEYRGLSPEQQLELNLNPLSEDYGKVHLNPDFVPRRPNGKGTVSGLYTQGGYRPPTGTGVKTYQGARAGGHYF